MTNSKMRINLDNKKFKTLCNSENREVSNDTIFHYKQNEDIITATYQGGSILQRQLIGKIFFDNHLEFAYQHINADKELITGLCKSYVSINKEGKIILEEIWQWTCKDNSSGQSTIMEI
jgi:hypothetical protein